MVPVPAVSPLAIGSTPSWRRPVAAAPGWARSATLATTASGRATAQARNQARAPRRTTPRRGVPPQRRVAGTTITSGESRLGVPAYGRPAYARISLLRRRPKDGCGGERAPVPGPAPPPPPPDPGP